MARVVRKDYNQRRREAATKFLSNISLDGTFSDVKMRSDSKVESGFFCLKYVNEKEKCSIFQEVEASNVTATFRERSNTGDKFGDTRHKKPRGPRQISVSEDVSHPFSSSESIGSGKSDGKFCKGRHEVRIIDASQISSSKHDRVALLSPIAKIPFYTFSILPFKKRKSKVEGKKDGRRRNMSSSRPLSTLLDALDPFLTGLEKCSKDRQMISYEQLLKNPVMASSAEKIGDYQITRCMSVDLGSNRPFPFPTGHAPLPNVERTNLNDSTYSVGNNTLAYSPYILDDPELISGRHRAVLSFPSYRTSVINYMKSSDLKKEINEKFKEKFPQVQLTLSKLRSIKRELKKFTKMEPELDPMIVAQAYVYFEKLVLKNAINKGNRKLCAAVCLILAAKMNDIKGPTLKFLLEKLESLFRCSRKDILMFEFPVVVALEFELHLPSWEVLPHYNRLILES